MIALILAQIASAPPVVAPPPVYFPTPDRAWGDRAAGPRRRIAIVVRAEGAVLYDGQLWIGARGTSSWRQTVQEAPDPRCGPAPAYGPQANEVSVQFAPNYRDPSTAPDRVSVTVRWARPSAGGCAGTRVVEMRESVVLDGATPVTLRGDAGLSVELRGR